MIVISDCPKCKYWFAEPVRDLEGYYICRHCSRVFPDDTHPESLTNKLQDKIESICGPTPKNNQETILRTRNRSNDIANFD